MFGVYLDVFLFFATVNVESFNYYILSVVLRW